MHLIMLVARCRLKQSYDHPSICTTKFSYTYPGSHNSQVFNLLHCSHRPLDSLNMRTGVMWRMCVYKAWCGDCNEMRNRALLRYWGCFFSLTGSTTPKRDFALSIGPCQFAHDWEFSARVVLPRQDSHLSLVLTSHACSPRLCFSK